MNERIRELALQAKFYADENNAHYLQNPHWIETFEEKFAESIVAECMEQVWYTREDYINNNISEVIKKRIKQHFGATT